MNDLKRWNDLKKSEKDRATVEFYKNLAIELSSKSEVSQKFDHFRKTYKKFKTSRELQKEAKSQERKQKRKAAKQLEKDRKSPMKAFTRDEAKRKAQSKDIYDKRKRTSGSFQSNC